jgi:hypothetical protein
MSVIEELSNKYYDKTGSSPEYSFWSWLDANGIEPNDKELKEVLNNIDNYL